ncbi:hypothetical protein DDE82_003208 [Stemphylium lycopersici]|uniref:Fungal-specific transcription factor domain-containing protein n=1 Tax=Stemphylium lycopersici TaxID=183478 RepID=A0A364N3G8_STELY|nr:hypothetical protein DDE82_003208 [Stemphylium lycopersici]RAR11052.1 hypothetical protein DDE83_004810 [Stemphylium lycopersici]
MDADRRLTKALDAANDALQHLAMSPDLGCLDCIHIDRLLGRVVDLPTEGNQRNSRRNLLVIRQWMISEGPSVVLLEVLGQLYWRLGELNSTQFEKFKNALRQQQPYTSLIQDTKAVTLIVQRIRHIQKSKADACQDFLRELTDLIGAKISAGGGMEPFLQDFYIHGICPGRTVATQSNSYSSLLQIANICTSTRYAMLSLSASYLCELIPQERETYHQVELYYSTQALEALTAQLRDGSHYDGALATSMLLMHHGMIHLEESPLCWSCHANILDAAPARAINHHSDPALFIRAQLILARTAQSSLQLQNTRRQAFEANDWLEGLPLSETSRVCGILGVSPQLLFSISSITPLASNPNRLHKLMYAQLQETQIQSLQQWSSEPVGPEKEVLLATAETFRLAALIYLRCRVYGFTRHHPSILELSEALHTVLLSLPVKGPLYTAIYPIWPFFIAAVTTNADKRDRLYQRVVPIREGDRNTLPPVLKRVSGLRVWLAGQDAGCLRREGWWDEMLSPSSSAMELGGNLLCLG